MSPIYWLTWPLLSWPMSKHRLGIIGAGAFTDFSLSAYQDLPNVTLAAITDPKLDAAKKLADQYGIQKTYVSNEELLADPDLDVVAVLTPPHTHNAIARQALEQNKHVLVEKPIAFTIPEAEALIQTAEQKKLQLTANLVLRHHPFHQEIATAVSDQRYGRLRQVITTALLARYPEDHWYWDKAISGGFFLNTFCHFLDLYDYVTGKQPVELDSRGDVETGYVITAQYPDGPVASLSANLKVTNDQELVETVYVFEQAVIKTTGWLPHQMTLTPETGTTSVLKAEEKLSLYRKILAEILSDLLKRVENPAQKTLITHHALLQAVVNPTRAEQN